MYDTLEFLNFIYFTTNNVIDFFHLNLFSYWKYFGIILSFFSYLLRENKSVESNNLLPFNIKSINPIRKYWIYENTHLRIVCLYFINICYDIFVSCDAFNFFWNTFHPKAVKVVYIVIINKYRYLMDSYCFILIKIDYVCPILY